MITLSLGLSFRNAFYFAVLAALIVKSVTIIAAAAIPVSSSSVWNCPAGAVLVDDRSFSNIVDYTINLPSLVSKSRRIATATLMRNTLQMGIAGDIVETGVYKGSTSAIIMQVLMKFDKCSRRFWAFDSFEGLPAPTTWDGAYGITMKRGELSASQSEFVSNLKSWSAWDESIIRITKGFFNATLPQSPVSRISFLRLDGDLYQSTLDALEALYERVVPGGYVYIDDYGSFEGCRNAVNYFREKYKISESLRFIRSQSKIRHIAFDSVWWKKNV